jgi:hypothetical protein
VQQGEDPQRAVGGDQVEIGHAASEQWVPLAEVVMNAQTGLFFRTNGDLGLTLHVQPACPRR